MGTPSNSSMKLAETLLIESSSVASQGTLLQDAGIRIRVRTSTQALGHWIRASQFVFTQLCQILVPGHFGAQSMTMLNFPNCKQ